MSTSPVHDRPQSTPRVLVTGGTGFLGRALVTRLRAHGAAVRVLARRDDAELRSAGVELILGDLRDAATVRAACADRDVVFHVAARAGLWGRYADYFGPNVQGTDHVLAGCRAGGVGRLVYTSSPSVVFDGRDIAGADESIPYPPRHVSHYVATKTLAEQHVLAASDAGLRTVSLRPHLVWGPGDSNILPRLVTRARAGKLRRIGDGRNLVDTTYIDNAVQAHIQAAEALARQPHVSGRAYFISNAEPVPLWDLVNGLLEAAGAPRVTRSISRSAAWLLASLIEAGHWLRRLPGEPELTRFAVRELSATHWFDISAARRDLGYEPTITIAEGLRRLAEWCR